MKHTEKTATRSEQRQRLITDSLNNSLAKQFGLTPEFIAKMDAEQDRLMAFRRELGLKTWEAK